MSFADLWAANEKGSDIIFNMAGYNNIKGEFHYINTANGKVRQIHIRVFSTTNYITYIIAEDDTVTFIDADLLNERIIKQETGTEAFYIMSQKATTEAIDMAIEKSVANWSQTDEAAADFIKNKPDIATDDEILEMLAQEDMLPVVADSDGALLSDENGNILLW
jgi:hypothetical protein